MELQWNFNGFFGVNACIVSKIKELFSNKFILNLFQTSIRPDFLYVPKFTNKFYKYNITLTNIL